jgi:hypothetical protein
MNYTTLFPNLLKQLPIIPETSFCYKYDNKKFYNKNNLLTHVFIPSGKQMILWFTKYDSKYYCLLLEIKNYKVVSCHFKYLSFDTILTSGKGTMIWVTNIKNELSLNKIIYLKGEYFKSKYITEHMEELKFVIDNYINNISYSSLIQLKLPFMSNNKNFLSTLINLNYNVYNIIIENNYCYNINNFMAIFNIKEIDYSRDIYELSCKDKNNNLIKYGNAMIHNKKTTQFVKNILNIKNISYENIEYSDDENCDSEKKIKSSVDVFCIFVLPQYKWVPYKISYNKEIFTRDKINQLEKKCINLLKIHC